MKLKDEPIMTEKQRRKAAKLIRKTCANYDRETKSCLPLELNYEPVECPQMHSYLLLCRYFRNAVLPADQALMTEIMDQSASLPKCRQCGNLFVPDAPNQLYCEQCALSRIRESKRLYARRKRQSNRKCKCVKP